MPVDMRADPEAADIAIGGQAEAVAKVVVIGIAQVLDPHCRFTGIVAAGWAPPGDAVDRIASTQEKRALPMPRSRFPAEMDFRKTSSAAEAVSAVWAAAVEPRGPTSPASIAPTELSGMPQIQVRGVWVYV